MKAEGVAILEPDRSYRVKLRVGVRDRKQDSLVQAVAMLGRSDRRGMTTLSFNGRL